MIELTQDKQIHGSNSSSPFVLNILRVPVTEVDIVDLSLLVRIYDLNLRCNCLV